ncbi:MAG: hypothetical protein IPK50_19540 [Fibrobacterota bacterium]|nr:MAG: hypothetical protein IPK50_19540 [Fibrobacterota bacterium]
MLPRRILTEAEQLQDVFETAQACGQFCGIPASVVHISTKGGFEAEGKRRKINMSKIMNKLLRQKLALATKHKKHRPKTT